MLDEGRYKARGVMAALGYTSAGKEQVAVLLKTAEGDEITWYGYFTEKTTERTLESLRALGWESDDIWDLSSIDKNEVTIVVEHEADQDGELRAKVRWINSGGALAMKETMSDADARAFGAKIKGAVIAHRQKTSGSSAPAQSKPAARTKHTTQRQLPPAERFADDFNGDDIPF
jgi:hypothetical protein